MLTFSRPIALLLTPLAIAVALTSGCESEVTTADLVDRELLAHADIADIICDCSEELGYETRGQCLIDSGERLPAQERCIHEAYARDESATKNYLECQLPLLSELTECLDNRFSCSEDAEDDIDACLDDFNLGSERCIEPPQSVERALEACF